MIVAYSRRAQRDLEEIFDFIASDNPEAACDKPFTTRSSSSRQGRISESKTLVRVNCEVVW
jgi:hypothetical protein